MHRNYSISTVSKPRALGLQAILATCFLIIPAASSAAKSKQVSSGPRTGPIPKWVETVEWSISKDEPSGTAAQIILIDQQAKLTADGSDNFYHQVVRLLTPDGVRSFSQQINEYSPEFGGITWHRLIVHRGLQAEDRLRSTKFETLQRESGLDVQILTGEITYAAVLSDVRVGDILETAYTTHYRNPLLAGHSGTRHFLGAGLPIVHERVRVHVPRELGECIWKFLVPPGTLGLPEPLYNETKLRAALRDDSTANEEVFTWEGTGLPAVEFDPMIPGRAYPYWPQFSVSTYTSWQQVDDWALKIFAAPKRLPKAAMDMIAPWKKLSDDERLARCVRWVEDDIRYFALDLGQHTLKPRSLEEVCSTRFGDCKDKAVLLVTLLREMGFEAWPALTNTYLRDRLHELDPAPSAFNHAIVAYKYLGTLRWVDPTLSKQGGAPGEWAMPRHKTALLIRAGEKQLVDLENDGPNEPDTVTLDHIRVDPQTGTATLATEVRLTGLAADFYRPSLMSMSSAERAKGWFNFMALFYRELEETSAPAFEDDMSTNTIVLRGSYVIPHFLRKEAGQDSIQVYAYALRTLLDPNTSRRRHWPLGLPAEKYLRHRIEVVLPFEAGVEQLPTAIKSSGLEYSAELGLRARTLFVQHDLRIIRDFVDAEQVTQFSDNVQEILNGLSTTVHGSPASNQVQPDFARPATANTPSP